MLDLVEYRLIRPDGTVLHTMIAPYGTSVGWEPDPGFEIIGPCTGQRRYLPDGEWVTRAEFPEGYPGPALLVGGPYV